MEKWQIPGASIAFVKDGKLIYARGFGKADEGKSVEPYHSLFRIASLSKPVTAIAIMKLVQEGKLSLDDKVFGKRGILNEAAYSDIRDDRIKNITLKHLLEHSAGWDRDMSACGDPMFDPVNIARAMNTKAPADARTIIRFMLRQKLDFSPGQKFAYSNLGYTILGRVIEKVSGKEYEKYVQSAILNPAGIHGMKLGKNGYEQKEVNEVRYYSDKQATSVCEPGKEVSCQYGGFNIEAMDAHGGWIASATDLAKLLTAVDGFPNKKDLLSDESMEAISTPSEVYPHHYSLGWFVNKKGNWWHSGCLEGASSMMARIHNGMGWVMLFNSNPMSGKYYAEMDKLMWKAIANVSTWPAHDLSTNESKLQ